MLARAHVVDRAVERDPIEPRPEVRSGLEPIDLLVGPHERFLHHVLRVLRPSGHPVGQSIDAAAVPLDEQAKGVLVAASRFRDGGRVVRMHLGS